MEELKCYKNDNDFSDYADRLHKIAFNSGYNKALDDFIRKCEMESRVILDEITHLSYYGLSMRELQRIAELGDKYIRCTKDYQTTTYLYNKET